MTEETGSVVRRLRLRAGLTQEGLAERSGVSVRTIRRIETGGQRNPQFASLVQLADALELSADDRHDFLETLGGVATPSVTTRSMPRQLSAAPRGFAGRGRELAALEGAAAGDGRNAVITVIAGAGGIGKTWLALRWAHDHLDRFPDGQLFVDLRGFSPDGDPVDPLAVVRGFLAVLGVDPAEMTGGLDELAALYRSRVAGMRMLVVLDNAATAEQVTPLLPGTAECTVLITSRQVLSGLLHRYGAHHVRLEILDDDDAYTLLAHRLGPDRLMAEPDATAALIRSCGRYPLALSLVASRAQTNSDLPLGEFVTELREGGLDALDDADPTASLPEVLSWSLRALTVEQRRVFALLGIAPGADIALRAVTHLADLPRALARRVLRQLEDASLLTRHPRDRYLLHDLVRGYAAGAAEREIPQEARDAAMRRVLDFYLHTAHTAGRLLEPNLPLLQHNLPTAAAEAHPPLPDAATAMDWLKAEHRNLMAAQHTATVLGWHHTVWPLAAALSTFHLRSGDHQHELTAWRAALDAANQLDDPAVRTGVHWHLGRVYNQMKQHKEAVHHFHVALDLAEDDGNLTDQGHVHLLLSREWNGWGDSRRGLQHATKALALFHTIGPPLLEASAHITVCWCHLMLEDYDTAATHCRQALHLIENDHPELEGVAHDRLGYIAHHTGHHQQAIEHYQRALTLFRGLGHSYETANTLDNLGHPHTALRQHDQARAAWQQAIQLYQGQHRAPDVQRVQQQLDTLRPLAGEPASQPPALSAAPPPPLPANGHSRDRSYWRC
ncbi:helix-turn-helix domain-containing protein [Amycolatopsis sp. H6(2020)]|nr:helix-turn-helix domain-containing protein [Amycolatopsis sp. H6(2020)]